MVERGETDRKDRPSYRTIETLSPKNERTIELQSTNAHAKRFALSLSAVDIPQVVKKERESRVECRRVLMRVDFPDSTQ